MGCLSASTCLRYWSIEKARAEIRLCYPLVAMCAHDCVPNTFRCIDGRAERGGDGFLQEVRARTDIKRGESITISYVDTVLPTPIRRRRLLRDKRFRCECERCRHRTELGRDVMDVVTQIYPLQ